MDNIEKKLEQILKEIREIKAHQDRNEEKLGELQNIIDNIKSDIYMDDDENFDFEMICPYCEHEFVIDTNQENQEIKCPKCENIIQLDWSGDIDELDEEDTSCLGNCHGCPGCDVVDEDDDM